MLYILFLLQYNIRSYPTTILYNQSVPHQFQGHHNAESITEFIQVRPLTSLYPAHHYSMLHRRQQKP